MFMKIFAFFILSISCLLLHTVVPSNGKVYECIGVDCPTFSFPENAENSTIVCNGTDKSFKDPTDCHYFYFCSSENQTASRMVGYHDEWKFCTFEHLIQNCSSVFCPAYMYDGVVPDPKNCGAYYRCVYGFPLYHHCPNGTIFDAEIGDCKSYETEPACLQKPEPNTNGTTTTTLSVPTTSTEIPTKV